MPITKNPKTRNVLESADIRDPSSFYQFLSINFQSSVLDDIYGQLFCIAGWSVMVACIHFLTERDVTLNSSMVGVLGGLLGFVVSLRTSSSYERFCEGRRVWSQILHSSRYFVTLVWLHTLNVPNLPDDAPEETPEEKEYRQNDETIRSLIEKQTINNLVLAYAIALKHFCRSEYGLYYEDLYPLVSFLPKHCFTSNDIEKPELLPLWQNAHDSGSIFVPSSHSEFDPTSVRSTSSLGSGYTSRKGSAMDLSDFNETPTTNKEASITIAEPPAQRIPRVTPIRRASTTLDLMPARLPPKRTWSYYLPVIGWVRSLAYMIFTKSSGPTSKKSDEETVHARAERAKLTSNVPLSISTFLNGYIASLSRRGLIDGVVTGQLLGAITGLEQSYTNLERLLNSGLPFAYQVHLKMTVWIFLLLLPFQIVEPLGWYSIMITVVTAFFYLGFCEIGAEIENPFDFGKNDLDLDLICSLIAKEITEIQAHPYDLNPWTYINHSGHTPMSAAGDNRTVPEMVAQAESSSPEEQIKLLNSLRFSIAGHFRVANEKGYQENTRKHRHHIKKAPRKKVEVFREST